MAAALPSTSLADLALLPAQLAATQQQVAALESLLIRVIILDDVMVPTAEALRLSGIKSANTLRARAADPGTVLRFKKVGKSITWSRNSCLLYAHAKRGLALPTAVTNALSRAA